MKRIKIYSSIFVPFLAVIITAYAFTGISVAKEERLASGAHISFEIGTAQVDRSAVLYEFFEKYNSPLTDHVETFIEVADQYGLDYRLLPAISCMESTCGKFMPSNSYNAWGWGVYGTNVIRFNDFDEAIKTVGKGIYEGYASKGLNTPAKMAPIYTPPRANHWLGGVTHFMNQMQSVPTVDEFANS